MAIRGRIGYINRRQLPAQQEETPDQELNRLREVYRVWVPRTEVWGIDFTRPFISFLTAVETVTFPAHTNGLSEGSLHTNSIARVVNAAGRHDDSRYVGVWDRATGAPRVVTAVHDNEDGTGVGRVTIESNEMASFDCQVAYVPFEDAHIVLSVDAPVGLGSKSHPIFDGDAKTLFTSNQWDGSRLRSPILLPSDFSLVLKVNAGWSVAFDNGAIANESEITFNQIRIPVVIYQERDFYVEGEPVPGHTLRSMAEARLVEAVR